MPKTHLKSTFSLEDIDRISKQNFELADNFCKALGYKDIEDMRNKYSVELENAKKNNNNVKQTKIESELSKTLAELTMLILEQQIGNFSLPSQFDIAEMVNDGMVKNGDAKQYLELMPTGDSEYDENEFVPNAISNEPMEEYIMYFKDPKTQRLANGSYQYKKSFKYIKADMIYYFLSGKLNDYLIKKIENLYKGYKIFITLKLFEIIATATPQKTITGTANDLFKALNQDVLPAMEGMIQLNSEYNYSNKSKLLGTSNMNNVLFICSRKIASLIRNGIETQLYNQQIFGASGKLLKPENLTTLGNKLEKTDENTAIVDTGKEWIDDNTIIVIDMTGIKNWLVLNATADQFFAANLAEVKYVHIWGHIEMLPWCRMFKYTNVNLTNLPGDTNE